ncbi:hypothetical protein HNP84_005969 [Thermocatellispora tengchongensis]|uniref:Uncharacterized protein n=1 Tax=Thermocatellispora tengchongensis TaxID=1073253 RepID=A0A840PJI6_9ACTN|nr:hypothetical protein [Thermocatellispora tengchongensis]MBB5136225.1 hypothetical protein [Thermocatellispora tengchongensis]
MAKAGRVLVDQLDQLDLVDQEGADLNVAAMWTAVAEIAGASKEQVRAALEVVEELVPESDGAAEAAMRAALVEKYNTVHPFLRLLGESKALSAAPWAARSGRGTPAAGAVAAAGEQEAAAAQGVRRRAGDRVVEADGVCQPGPAAGRGGS